MSYKNFTQDTLAQVAGLQTASKAGISTGLGLTAYNLEQTAKLLVPEFSPLRSEIPRVTPPGNLAGLAPHWKQLTSFNNLSIRPYVSEGKRGSLITYTEADKTANYTTQGLENNATFEAESAGIGFENIDDIATLGLLQEFFAQEERVIIGGNTGLALGATATPVITVETTGGTLADSTTYYIGCVALTYDGWLFATQQSQVPQSVSQANAGPYGGNTTFNGGSGIISALATGVTATPGNTSSMVATVAVKTGAYAYAWFVSTTASTSSHQYFYSVTTINSVNITAPGVNTGQDFQALNAATDYSKNALSYDGILSQTAQGGYVYQMPTGTVGVGGAGTGLTAAPSGAGVGIVEIDNALAYFWNTYNSGIDEILVNAQEMNNITNKVLSSGSAPLIRFNYTPEQIKAGQIIGGAVVGLYLNKFAMNGPVMIPIKLHPYVPAGTIILRPIKVPYQITNVGTILRMNCRKDYYQLAWPLTQRQREWGIYNETVLQNYAPFMFGMITNIANK